MAATAKNGPTSREQELIEDLLQFKYDPEGFVRYAFPWGVPNTPLAKLEGPRTWQTDIFKQISDHLMLDMEKQRIGLGAVPVYLSISSGRGIGKSAPLHRALGRGHEESGPPHRDAIRSRNSLRQRPQGPRLLQNTALLTYDGFGRPLAHRLVEPPPTGHRGRGE